MSQVTFQLFYISLSQTKHPKQYNGCASENMGKKALYYGRSTYYINGCASETTWEKALILILCRARSSWIGLVLIRLNNGKPWDSLVSVMRGRASLALMARIPMLPISGVGCRPSDYQNRLADYQRLNLTLAGRVPHNYHQWVVQEIFLPSIGGVLPWHPQYKAYMERLQTYQISFHPS